MWFTTWWWWLEVWRNCPARSTRTILRIAQSSFFGSTINLWSPFTRKMSTSIALRMMLRLHRTDMIKMMMTISMSVTIMRLIFNDSEHNSTNERMNLWKVECIMPYICFCNDLKFCMRKGFGHYQFQLVTPKVDKTSSTWLKSLFESIHLFNPSIRPFNNFLVL